MRADAARNRGLALAAAERLLRETGDPAAVSMDAVAAAAGVGKGTLFRRFGDRTGLLAALYVERSEHLRSTLPELVSASRDPVDRVVAILGAVLGFKLDNVAVTTALEAAGRGSPYDNPTYQHWHRLLRAEVVAAHQEVHADFLAHALLASVRSDLLAHLRTPRHRLRADLEVLVRSCLRTPG